MYTRLEANGTYNLYPHNGLEPLAENIVPDVLPLFDPESRAELEKEKERLEIEVEDLKDQIRDMLDQIRNLLGEYDES